MVESGRYGLIMHGEPLSENQAGSGSRLREHELISSSAASTPTSFDRNGLMPPTPSRFAMSSHPSTQSGVDTPASDSMFEGGDGRGLLGASTGRGPEISGGGSAEAERTGKTGPEFSEKIGGGNKLRRRYTGVVGGSPQRRRRLWIIIALLLVIIAAAVAIPVGVIFGRKDSSSSSGNSSGGSNGGTGKNGPTTGGDGSTATTEDGTTFTYQNPFGGFWVDDPDDPFNNNAQPNSWTPPLNTSWRFGIDRIYGVNLGGLFVLEPFIVPALFEKYQNGTATVVDEWTLSEAMAADTSPGGGLSQIEDHYNTFITEQDIAQMAGAGLNWIRLPIPFWTIDKWNTESDQEPFLARISWKYILRIFRWARKYGMRINLDLHTAPGSQNGFNHSGKSGQINFMNGIMGFANAQRMLGYIRVLTEFISQPEYQQLIPMFGIINEALTGIIGQDNVSHFYLQAYDMIREITGIGEGKGPFIGIHDGFESLTSWKDFFPGSDRINLDTHPYFAFGGVAIDPSVAPKQACLSWGLGVNQSMFDFGMTVAGEFSNGINDCGLFLNGVTGTSGSGADCNFWNNIGQWNQTTKDQLKQFALASMDALQNWFFWTWKIGNSSATGTVQAPLWSYQLGLENDFIPTDPRSAVGMCESLSATGTQFPGTFPSAWMTGGEGAGTISSDVRESFTAWPPTTLSGISVDVNLIPSYTSTAPMETLPSDTFFSDLPKTVTIGDGWADPSDTASLATEVAGCSYPDPWMALGAPVPTNACTGGQSFAARDVKVTQPPQLR